MFKTRFIYRTSICMLVILASCSTWHQDQPSTPNLNQLMISFFKNNPSCQDIVEIRENLREQTGIYLIEDLEVGDDLSITEAPNVPGEYSVQMESQRDSSNVELVNYLFVKLNFSTDTLANPFPEIHPNQDIVNKVHYAPCLNGDWIVVSFEGKDGVYWYEGTEILKIKFPSPFEVLPSSPIQTIVLAENLDGKT